MSKEKGQGMDRRNFLKTVLAAGAGSFAGVVTIPRLLDFLSGVPKAEQIYHCPRCKVMVETPSPRSFKLNHDRDDWPILACTSFGFCDDCLAFILRQYNEFGWVVTEIETIIVDD